MESLVGSNTSLEEDDEQGKTDQDPNARNQPEPSPVGDLRFLSGLRICDLVSESLVQPTRCLCAQPHSQPIREDAEEGLRTVIDLRRGDVCGVHHCRRKEEIEAD